MLNRSAVSFVLGVIGVAIAVLCLVWFISIAHNAASPVEAETQTVYYAEMSESQRQFLSVCSSLDITPEVGQLAYAYCSGLIRGIASGHLITVKMTEYQRHTIPMLWCIDKSVPNSQLVREVAQWFMTNPDRVNDLSKSFRDLDLSIAVTMSALGTSYPCKK